MSKHTSPTGSDNIIDTRDVIALWEDLTSDRDAYQSDIDEAQEALDELEAEHAEWNDDELGPKLEEAREALDKANQALAEWEEENEWGKIDAFKNDLDTDVSHAEDGVTLVNSDYFTEYAEDYFRDTHDAKVDTSKWPFNCIDWEWAARELQYDYSSIDFDGSTFYYCD